jgi:hypothetical protein
MSKDSTEQWLFFYVGIKNLCTYLKRFPDFLTCVTLDLWKKGRKIGDLGEILIREMIFTHIQMEGVILNNCAIIDVDISFIFCFCPFFTGPGQRRSGWLYTSKTPPRASQTPNN